jgi:hypothetical protein
MNAQTDRDTGRRKGSESKPENNRRRLQKLLRTMMRHGMAFSAADALSAVTLPHTSCRRIIE